MKFQPAAWPDELAEFKAIAEAAKNEPIAITLEDTFASLCSDGTRSNPDLGAANTEAERIKIGLKRIRKTHGSFQVERFGMNVHVRVSPRGPKAKPAGEAKPRKPRTPKVSKSNPPQEEKQV